MITIHSILNKGYKKDFTLEVESVISSQENKNNRSNGTIDFDESIIITKAD